MGSTQGSASCFRPLGVSHARPRGDCLGLRYANSDWMDWACQSSRMFAFQQQNKARPDKSTKPAPRHCTWDGRTHASPCPTETRGNAHAHATPRYAIPINVPPIPTISWPVWPAAAEACDDIYRQTARSHFPTALTSVPGYLLTCLLRCGWKHLHLSLPPRRCPRLTRQARFPCRRCKVPKRSLIWGWVIPQPYMAEKANSQQTQPTPLSACLLPHCGVRPPSLGPHPLPLRSTCSPIFRPMLNPFD